MTTGLLYDERYLEHHTGEFHPECPERLVSTINYLKQLNWFKNIKQYKAQNVDIDWLLTVHSIEYIKRVEESCLRGMKILDTQDVGISKKSFEIANLAAGGVLRLADELVHKNIKNAFALLRPPGHHAEKNIAMGFCLFNNVAILAKYLQKKHGMDKVLILDWDVHHGNGTQHTFYEDPSVYYMSLHQYPFYPGTGGGNETGEGKGERATLNCPMEAGSSDKEYKEAFLKKILPAIKNFKSEIILISAGFDAHKEDPLANINLSTDCFKWMTERIVEAANEHCDGRIISLLEGGYNLKVLPECVGEHVEVLCGLSNPGSNPCSGQFTGN